MTDREKELQRLGAKLDPGLKGWIDRVIVPGMVRQYLAKKQKADIPRNVAHSPSHELSAEVSQ